MASALDQMRASPTTCARVEVDGGSRISALNHTDQIFAGVGGIDYRGTESPSRSLTCSTYNQHVDKSNLLKLLHYLHSSVNSEHSFKFRALNDQLVSIQQPGANNFGNARTMLSSIASASRMGANRYQSPRACRMHSSQTPISSSMSTANLSAFVRQRPTLQTIERTQKAGVPRTLRASSPKSTPSLLFPHAGNEASPNVAMTKRNRRAFSSATNASYSRLHHSEASLREDQNQNSCLTSIQIFLDLERACEATCHIEHELLKERFVANASSYPDFLPRKSASKMFRRLLARTTMLSRLDLVVGSPDENMSS